jgi:hypothetical protein
MIEKDREKEKKKKYIAKEREEDTFKVYDKKCGLHLELERLLKSYLAQLQHTIRKKIHFVLLFENSFLLPLFFFC